MAVSSTLLTYYDFLQQTNSTAVTETDPQKLKERLQETLLELQEYKIKLEKALQVRLTSLTVLIVFSG